MHKSGNCDYISLGFLCRTGTESFNEHDRYILCVPYTCTLIIGLSMVDIKQYNLRDKRKKVIYVESNTKYILGR